MDELFMEAYLYLEHVGPFAASRYFDRLAGPVLAHRAFQEDADATALALGFLGSLWAMAQNGEKSQ